MPIGTSITETTHCAIVNKYCQSLTLAIQSAYRCLGENRLVYVSLHMAQVVWYLVSRGVNKNLFTALKIYS